MRGKTQYHGCNSIPPITAAMYRKKLRPDIVNHVRHRCDSHNNQCEPKYGRFLPNSHRA